MGQGFPSALCERGFRKFSSQLCRVWVICGDREELREPASAASFEEVRVYMAKWDAEARNARGEALPEDVRRALRQLMAASVESGEVLTQTVSSLPRK